MVDIELQHILAGGMALVLIFSAVGLAYLNKVADRTSDAGHNDGSEAERRDRRVPRAPWYCRPPQGEITPYPRIPGWRDSDARPRRYYR
jgi:hypothetical protein